MTHKKIIIAIIAIVALPLAAHARIGVGVAAGKIVVDDPLRPGGIYGLPILPVVNTGDETSNYGVSIEYHEQQPEQRPPAEWFRFRPDTFTLDAGQSQEVQVRLQVPVDARPGDYFAYLEAHPVQGNESGTTSIGIAAASKLYFTIAPANVWQGIYYRAIALFLQYTPWTYIGSAVLGVLILIKLFRKFFKFQVNVTRRSNNNPEE